MYSAISSVIMNTLAWTVGSAIIARDKKYINAKTAILNPNAVAATLGLVLLIADLRLPTLLEDIVGVFAGFAATLCMCD